MSIRNATIAMRKRKIGLFEQERIAPLDHERQRRNGTSSKAKKKEAAQFKRTERASWRDN
ncbi:hypothetical protein ACFONN_05610 [Dyella humi]|uniref:Uncharacterized protein n=1 Tax=Dyella humi TaxID=1770547 RepID=A0ABW8IHC0_9GAMM